MKHHPKDQRGNSDVLILTRPDVISSIHHEYLAAGADIIETNTFSSTAIAQSDYALEPLVYELNVEGARLAKAAAVEWTAKTPDQPRFAAGSMGPMNRTLSISPDVNDPSFRGMTFDQARDAYEEQVRGLIDGGVDLLLLETIFDTLNAKAAIVAIENVFEERGVRLPLMISVTITDKSGRTLSGQTLDAFYVSIRHARPFSVGINCALGARDMRPYLAELAAHGRVLRQRLSERRPAECVRPVRRAARGDRPAAARFRRQRLRQHRRRLLRDDAGSHRGGAQGGGGAGAASRCRRGLVARRVDSQLPSFQLPKPNTYSQFSGLETLTIRPDSNFQMIGERTNVTGSARFARLIKSGNYAEAVQVAAEQVRGGANLIDVNMDEGMLDSEQAMTTFLNYIATEPEIARVPVMIDSSKWSVIEAGLKCVQGKGVVNSISLKEGEADFLHKAKLIQRYGAGVVVMAFDEVGPGRHHRSARSRSASAPTSCSSSRPGSIPPTSSSTPTSWRSPPASRSTTTTRSTSSRRPASSRRPVPGVKISGGVSNLSFSFRGNDIVREAMHSAFLFHAIKAGMDMGIVNAGQLVVYEDIRKDLLEHVEDVIFNRRPDATERLVQFAETVKGAGKKREEDLAWREAQRASSV